MLTGLGFRGFKAAPQVGPNFVCQTGCSSRFGTLLLNIRINIHTDKLNPVPTPRFLTSDAIKP